MSTRCDTTFVFFPKTSVFSDSEQAGVLLSSGSEAAGIFKAGAAVPPAVSSSPGVTIRRVSQSAAAQRGFHRWGSLLQMHCVD